MDSFCHVKQENERVRKYVQCKRLKYISLPRIPALFCFLLLLNPFLLEVFFSVPSFIFMGQDDPSLAGKPLDPRPTIVFTTIEHPIMREWALAGVDVEVFPSGLVLEEMESPAVSLDECCVCTTSVSRYRDHYDTNGRGPLRYK